MNTKKANRAIKHQAGTGKTAVLRLSSIRAYIAPFAFVAVILVWPLVDGPSSNPQGQAVAPALKKVLPRIIAAGSPTFTIRVKGYNFGNLARVMFDGVRLESSRVTSEGTIALAEIDSSLVAAAAEHTVQVINADGSASEKGSLSVVEADPELRIRLSDNAVEEGTGADLILEITGEGFASKSSKVYVGGVQQEKSFISESRILFAIPSSLTDDAAYLPVSVVNNQTGDVSNTEIFFVVARSASLGSVDPESITVGTGDFPIQVTGIGFKAGARILLNGSPLVTTSPEEGLLEAIGPGRLRSAPGQIFVRVEQEGVQSSDLAIIVSPSDEPFILSASPTAIRQGEPSPAVWVVGSGFTSGIRVLIDGQDAQDEDRGRRTRTLIKIRLSEELVSITGSHSVQIIDRDGNPSNASSFEVTPDITVDTLVGGKREGLNAERCVALSGALLRRPSRLVVGDEGEIYFVDYQNHLIRSIDPNSGQVCSIAGTGSPGYSDSGDDPGFDPTFSYPLGIVLQSDGSILVSDSGNDVLRRIRRPSAGAVTVDTYAGSYSFVEENARRARLNATRVGLTGFHSGEGLVASFRKPDDMVVAADGSIYLSDAGNHSIRRISLDGSKVLVETVAGNGVPGFADGEASKARFNVPTGLALSPDGRSLFVADTNNHRIRRLDLVTHQVETLAGRSGEQGDEDGPSFVANFNQPTGLALDADGTLYVSEVSAGRIRRVDASGNVSILAGRLNSSVSKSRDGSGVFSRFNAPRGIALDLTRRVLYVADLESSAVRRIMLSR